MAGQSSKKGFFSSTTSVIDHIPLQLRNKASNIAEATSVIQGASHKGYFLLRKKSVDEREDNRKNESSENRKKEEKAKAKAEKDFRKVVYTIKQYFDLC